jgi:outer membrane lipoprotein
MLTGFAQDPPTYAVFLVSPVYLRASPAGGAGAAQAYSTTGRRSLTLLGVGRLGLLALLPALVLAGCVRPPAPLADAALTEVSIAEAQAGRSAGARVRWGGTIVDVIPEADQTCFEVVSRPLDRRARPTRTDESEGRFLACAPGFYDPAIYAADRELTVVGTIGEPVTRKIGEYEYRYAQLHAEHVFLWPERRPEPAYPPGVYWGWGYSNQPYWGPYWDPYY